MAEQRTKEIGVMKTFGATTTELIFLLTRDFTKWILLANLIAWPSAWYFLDRWLQDFAYRINVFDHWPVFFLAAIVSFFIAILTVAGQAIRVAHSSPVIALKYDG
jgi:putative ABC transport system permease protein